MLEKLEEIFPLRLRLREEMRFFRIGDFVVAERAATGQRYTLRPWQYELLTLLNGSISFRDASKSIYSQHRGDFTVNGLLNFYRWLYDENFVECVCDSMYEMAPIGASTVTHSQPQASDDGLDALGNISFLTHPEAASEKPRSFQNLENQVAFELWDDPDEQESLSENDHPDSFETFEEDGGRIEALLNSTGRAMQRPAVRRALAIAAGLAFLLSVIRIGQVTSPLFEPVGQRLAMLLSPNAEAVTVAASERTAAAPTMDRVAPAARVDGGVRENGRPLPQPVPSENAPSSQEQSSAQTVIPASPMEQQSKALAKIETLRAELEECRIRRDEYYLQNDETGYRREVHRMTSIANEIGKIENEL